MSDNKKIIWIFSISILYILVILTMAFYILNYTTVGQEMVAISLVVSSLVQVIGIALLFGKYTILAGFNTMTEEDRMKYNMDSVCSAMGTIFIVLSYISFGMIVSADVNNHISYALLALFIALLLISSIWIGTSQRFKATV